MFGYVLNTHLTLLVNEVWVDKELMLMKNQQKIKALLNGADVLNVEQCTISVLALPRG